MKRVDPHRTPIVFNCGMGAVRTTYAMVAACLIRRKQYMSLGMRDPFLKQARTPPSSFASTPGGLQAVLALEQAEQQKEHNESLLKLAYLLQQCEHTLLLLYFLQTELIVCAARPIQPELCLSDRTPGLPTNTTAQPRQSSQWKLSNYPQPAWVY